MVAGSGAQAERASQQSGAICGNGPYSELRPDTPGAPVKLIRVGRRRINLEYLICDEEGDGSEETKTIPAGGVRITLESGKEFDVVGDDAEKYRRHVEALLMPDPGPGPDSERSGAVAHAVDPSSGQRLPRTGRQGKKSG